MPASLKGKVAVVTPRSTRGLCVAGGGRCCTGDLCAHAKQSLCLNRRSRLLATSDFFVF